MDILTLSRNTEGTLMSNQTHLRPTAIVMATIAFVGALTTSPPIAQANDPRPSIPMCRVYNPNGDEHFYTRDDNERGHLVAVGWNDEGIGWFAPTSGIS